MLVVSLVAAPVFSFGLPLTREDLKAKRDIQNALSDAVDHKWAQYDMINASRQSDNGSVIVIYNKSADVPVPPPTPCPPNQFYNKTTGQCQEVPKPEPPKPPVKPGAIPPLNTSENVRVGFIADIDDNNGLDKQLQQLKSFDVQLFAFAGDAGYNSLSGALDRLSANGFNKDNTIGACGNHDSCSQLSSWLGQSKANYDTTKKGILFVTIKGSDNLSCIGSQKDETKNSLQKNATYKVVVIHQPFVTVKSNHPNNGAFNCYNPIFKENGVSVVDEGHNHNYQRFMIDGMSYVLTGTGTHDEGGKMYPVGSATDGQGHTALFKKTGDNGITVMDFNIKNSTKIVNGWFVSEDGKTILDSWSQK